MARRTIEISRNPAHLALSRGQLLVIPKEDGEHSSGWRRDSESTSRTAVRPDLATIDALHNRIPVEDVGMLVVDHSQTTYTHSALSALAGAGSSVVICGDDHLPAGILLPVSSHTEQVWRITDQINCSKVLRKQLWQALIRAKLEAQALALPTVAPARSGLLAMAKKVRSGDASNLEAHAAKVYWRALFPPTDSWRFRRTPGAGSDTAPPNNLLDYGYAILRAAVARALVGAGLMPAIGIQHSNRSNAFCLADDLVEPLRPLIDRRVKRLFEAGRLHLDQPTKAELLLVLTATVQTEHGASATVGPLEAALLRYAASLAQSYADGAVQLHIPVDSTTRNTSSETTADA